MIFSMRFLKWAGITILLIFFIFSGFLLFLIHNLPDIKSLEDYHPPIVTRIYADDGQIIDELYTERRILVPLEKMPPYLIKAFIAAEDERFYEHKGLDWIGIMRAIIKDIKARRIVQGGSTITQQTVKSILLSSRRSIYRKLRELILAHRLEKYLTKDEILSIYLNQIYFGHGAYGVEAAAQTYFGKHVWELDLPEAALLAGLPKGPMYYSPYRHFERAKRRQLYVLKRMVECNYITEEEKEEAWRKRLKLKSISYQNKACLAFLDYVRQYLLKKYGYNLVYKGGLQVYTTASIKMHEIAKRALISGIEEIEKRHKENKGKIEGAVVCLEAQTGFIKVLIGGREFERGNFNRAIQARRQPGSAFKPIIYAAAIDKGYNPSSTLYDYPVVYEEDTPHGKRTWRPRNYEGRFHGPISLRDALVHSRNAATIRLLRDIGVGYVIQYAKRLGINSSLNHDLSLALGSACLSPLELTKVYAIFANQGKYIEPIAVLRVVDRDGNVLEDNKPQPKAVISPETAYIITNILEDVILHGTGRNARALGRPAAGKTGTTDNYTDAWFIGYTPSYVAGVWVGCDDCSPLGKRETGGRAAAPIWLSFMKEALKDRPIKNFRVPPGIIFARKDNGVFDCFKR